MILPNIVFKAYLRRLYGKISRLTEIQDQLGKIDRDLPMEASIRISDLAEEMANANEGIMEEFGHIQNHYINTSLFLETLLRQSHFEKGRYVLKKKACNFKNDIIYPLIEQYSPKLKARNIQVDLSWAAFRIKPLRRWSTGDLFPRFSAICFPTRSNTQDCPRWTRAGENSSPTVWNSPPAPLETAGTA